MYGSLVLNVWISCFSLQANPTFCLYAILLKDLVNDKKVVAKASFGVLKWSSQVLECWNHTSKDAYMIWKFAN